MITSKQFKQPEYFELSLLNKQELDELKRLYYQFQLERKTRLFLNSGFNQVIEEEGGKND